MVQQWTVDLWIVALYALGVMAIDNYYSSQTVGLWFLQILYAIFSYLLVMLNCRALCLSRSCPWFTDGYIEDCYVLRVHGIYGFAEAPMRWGHSSNREQCRLKRDHHMCRGWLKCMSAPKTRTIPANNSNSTQQQQKWMERKKEYRRRRIIESEQK